MAGSTDSTRLFCVAMRFRATASGPAGIAYCWVIAAGCARAAGETTAMATARLARNKGCMTYNSGLLISRIPTRRCIGAGKPDNKIVKTSRGGNQARSTHVSKPP
ncbi:hypothetical protein D3C72_1935330 [compost metagenome]